MQKCYLTTKVKKYEADMEALPLRVVKDLIKVINIEKIIKESKTDDELIMKVGGAIIMSYNTFEKYLITIFEGLTEEELLDTSVTDVAKTITSIVNFTIMKLTGVGEDLKKILRANA